MTKKTKGASAETWTYGYDHRNQMTWAEQRATDGGTLQLRSDYLYDVFGNRIDKQVDDDGDTTIEHHERYSYDGWKPGSGFVGTENWDIWADLEGDNDNAVHARYIRGDAIDEVFAWINSAGDPYWRMTDRLQSVRDVIINDGTIKNTIVFDGWGNITSETSVWRGRYAWTGREFDMETDFQYNRARYYDPAIGRWTSRDPIGFEAGDSNIYRYVKNRHVTELDPSGLRITVRYGGWQKELADGYKNWLLGKPSVFDISGKTKKHNPRWKIPVKVNHVDYYELDDGRLIFYTLDGASVKRAIQSLPKSWTADRELLEALISDENHLEIHTRNFEPDGTYYEPSLKGRWSRYRSKTTVTQGGYEVLF